MIRGFIPKELHIKDCKGKNVKVKYINVVGDFTKGKIGIDQYYTENFAVFKLTTQAEIESIEGYKSGWENGAELYRKVFNVV